MIPAKRSPWRNPVCKAMAPPWEKPARTIREEAIPRPRSARDQRLDPRLRGPDTRLVLTPDPAVVEDVVPGPHNVAAVDGDGLPRRVGKHEAHGQRGRQIELRHHRLEVVAIGAETVHPDDGGPRGGRRLHLDRVELLVTHESTA